MSVNTSPTETVAPRIERLDSYERTPVSATTRTLLCHFAAGDLQRPVPRLAADWEAVFQGVCSHGLLSLTQRYLLRHHDAAYPPQAFRQQVQAAHRLSAMRMALRGRKFQRVLAELGQTDVDFMVVKGPAVAHTIYPDPGLRAFNDLDLVVRERDWTAMHHALINLGFSPEHDWPQPPPKLVPEAVVYELKYWHRALDLLVEVHYDDILNAGLAARDAEGFWRRARLVEVEGLLLKVMCLEDQLIHLCAHAHYHGYTRLNWFADLALLVRDHASDLDWDQVVRTVRVEEAQVGVYYSLLFLERLLGVDVPKGVLAALRPDLLRRWLHERYLPAAGVLSLEPMWRPDFSFYFQPLLKRLLPDLLVMGRRRDKLRYLRRLLLPPRDWLRFYYRLDAAQPLAVVYLLHPFKLVYHALAELAGLR